MKQDLVHVDPGAKFFQQGGLVHKSRLKRVKACEDPVVCNSSFYDVVFINEVFVSPVRNNKATAHQPF